MVGTAAGPILPKVSITAERTSSAEHHSPKIAEAGLLNIFIRTGTADAAAIPISPKAPIII